MTKKRTVLVALVLGLCVTAVAQNNIAPAPSGGTTATPEYTGVFYTRGVDGTLTALPRATVKIGKLGGIGITLPVNIPSTAGPLVIKLEGSGDPAGVINMSRLQKGKERAVEFDVRAVGGRVFEIGLKSPTDGDYVVALKSTNPLSMPDLFAFRVGGAK